MPSAIASALRSGMTIDDLTFDRVFPARHRVQSWLHWTPVDVARRACALLVDRPAARVLDVGSGVGKLCLVGALSTMASWIGIDVDAERVEVARRAAAALGVSRRVSFVHGDATSADWSAFDAIYLFNPYLEHLFNGSEDALARRDRYAEHVARTEEQLAAAPIGIRVVLLHGFGGTLPAGYALVHSEEAHGDQLQLWVRRASRRARTDVA